MNPKLQWLRNTMSSLNLQGLIISITSFVDFEKIKNKSEIIKKTTINTMYNMVLLLKLNWIKKANIPITNNRMPLKI